MKKRKPKDKNTVLSFIKDPRCHVCNSPLRPKIEEMYATQRPYKEIMKFCMDNGLKVHKSSLWRHNKKHRMPSRIEKQTDKLIDMMFRTIPAGVGSEQSPQTHRCRQGFFVPTGFT